jgi:hypothetical protein
MKMRKQFLAAMALAIPFGMSAAWAQPAEVVQTQANPPGNRPVSNTPPNPASADSPVPAAMPADASYHGGPYPGALTAPPQEAMNKNYPACSATIRDECVNPRQAGMSYGHQPLAYWPGQPASEMRGSAGGGHRASRHIARRHRD